MSSTAVGQRIYKARIDMGMSVEELARFLGRSVSTVNRIEKGKQDLNIDQLYAIAQALQVGYSDLILD